MQGPPSTFKPVVGQSGREGGLGGGGTNEKKNFQHELKREERWKIESIPDVKLTGRPERTRVTECRVKWFEGDSCETHNWGGGRTRETCIRGYPHNFLKIPSFRGHTIRR